MREHTGIALSDAKRQLVYGRLSRRLRALKLGSFGEYIELLERGVASRTRGIHQRDHDQPDLVLPRAASFRISRDATLLPQIVARDAGVRRARIWCCAASTGEEPYSIAMVLREAAPLLHGFDIKVLATDLDSAVLATAANGIYNAERLQSVGNARASRFFRKGSGAHAGKFRVQAELRNLITFKQLNLMHEWPVRGPFDAIFCRNVIIYFDKDTQRALFARMAALQRPGDILFLGHSESLYRVSDQYELVGRTIYRRIDA